jgi:hypothetical protein
MRDAVIVFVAAGDADRLEARRRARERGRFAVAGDPEARLRREDGLTILPNDQKGEADEAGGVVDGAGSDPDVFSRSTPELVERRAISLVRGRRSVVGAASAGREEERKRRAASARRMGLECSPVRRPFRRLEEPKV